MTRFSKKGQKKIAEVMKELEEGTLTRGPLDTPVHSHKRALKIAEDEARQLHVVKKKPHRKKS